MLLMANALMDGVLDGVTVTVLMGVQNVEQRRETIKKLVLLRMNGLSQ